MASEDQLIQKVLGNPSLYPDELKSYIQRLIPGNPLIQLDKTQLPHAEAIRVVGAANQPAFQNSTSAYGSGYQVPGFWIDPLGLVHLAGLAVPPAAGLAMWTLPAGYRPLNRELFSTASATGATNVIGRVDVDASGNVIFVNGGTSWVTVSGITFRSY